MGILNENLVFLIVEFIVYHV